MRVLKPNPWLAGLGALLGLFMSAHVVKADVTTDHPASILVFPKVIADGTRDTLIQISNTTNGVVYMHCVYVDASPSIPNDPNSPPLCQATDFEAHLTKQQPTIWRVSTGRVIDPTGPIGSCENFPDPNNPLVTHQNCPGFDPGNIPNTTVGIPGEPGFQGFRGELKCVQVDGPGGAPVGGNALKGEAIIEGPNGTTSAYNALGIVAIDGPAAGKQGTVSLDNVDYNSCPNQLVLNQFAEDADDPALRALGRAAGTVPVETDLTVVPCTEDFLHAIPESVSIDVEVTDEMESKVSAPFSFQCWIDQPLDYNLGAFLFGSRNNSTVLKTVLRSTSASGILAIAEDYRVINQTRTGSSAVNLYAIGARSTPDRIILDDAPQTAPGTCAGGSNDGGSCYDSIDCPDGGSCGNYQVP